MNSLRHEIAEWNLRYPFDLWWRRRYRIPFGSAQHREMRLLDIRAEYEQEIWLIEQRQLAAQEQEKQDREQLGALLTKPEGLQPLLRPQQQEEIAPFDSQADVDESFDQLMASLLTTPSAPPV